MVERAKDPNHPEELSELQEELALKLFEIGAIQSGGFSLKLHDIHPEAPLSPLYINLRILQRFPKVKRQAVDVYAELVKQLEFDLLAGVPTAATPLVSSLSDRLGVGMITPWTDSKKHGSGARIDGLLPGDVGLRVVLVDDLVTGADSKLEAVDILVEARMVVADVVVLIDREQGGREQLAEHNLNLHAAMTITQLLCFYERTGKISPEEHKRIKDGMEALTKYMESRRA